jgi:hypothetical protein
MVTDGALRPEDFSFPVGDITDIQTSGGITGGGVSGDVVLRLEDTYASGDVFNVKFVNENQSNSITSPMIKDGEVGSADIATAAINGEHLANSFHVERDQANGAIVTVKNNSTFETSHGLEARGYYGAKGIGTYAGLYGEGTIYGVYAKASNPLNYGLYVEGRAFCTNGGWGDVAEYVGSDEKLESGDVVIIDPDGRNKVKKCSKSYDTRVAGVVSSDPTITVGRTAEAEGNYPLALTGIVPCKAIAQPAIQAGDLLTTSEVPGYAKKATEPEVGTILGKALEPLASGKGLINVLVNTR